MRLRIPVVVAALFAAPAALANACNAPLVDVGRLARLLWVLGLCGCCAVVLLCCGALGAGLKTPDRFRSATLVLSSCGALFVAAVCANANTAPDALLVLLVLTTFASAIAALVQWQSLKSR